MWFIRACIKAAIEYNDAMVQYKKMYTGIDFDRYACPFKYK